MTLFDGLEFETFWDAYDKKVGAKKVRLKWNKLSFETRKKIMEHIAVYVKITPDKQYRKNPLTYLNGECWNDELIIPDEMKRRLIGLTYKEALEINKGNFSNWYMSEHGKWYERC